MRKIIQITSTGVSNNSCTQCEMMLTALCDDGSLWLMTNKNFSSWERIANVPQGIEPPDRWPR